MLFVPQKGIVRVEHNLGGTVPASNVTGTAVTTGGSSNTKGTPVQIFASTPFDTFLVTIVASCYGVSTAASEGALDILIGAATEEVLIPNLLMGYCGGDLGAISGGPKRWDFPLNIPAGSRIAAQAAGVRTSTAVQVAIFLYGGGLSPWRTGSKVTTYGMGTVPNGTTISPGASGAEGAWAQMTASTTEDHFALVPSFQPTGDTSINNRNYFVDLGVGAATEEEVAQSYWFRTEGAEKMEGPWNSFPTFIDIPAGTRLAMRASNNGSNDGGYNGVIHAVS